MKKIKFLMTAVIFLGAAGVCPAQTLATPEPTPKAKPTEVPPPHLTKKEIYKKLELSKEQHQLLRNNRAAYRKMIAELEGKLKVLQVELENEMEKPAPDEAKLDQIAEKIGDVQGLKVSEKIKAELTVEKKILTPQQCELLRTLQGKESSAIQEFP